MYPFDRNGYPIFPGCVILEIGMNSVWVVTSCDIDPYSWLGLGVSLKVNMMTDNVPFFFGDARSENRFSYEMWQINPDLEIIERHVA